MQNMKKAFFILGLALTCGAYSSMAQIYVKIRPARPHYERTVAPSRHHVWIDEDWQPRGNTYEFRGGHWAEPPRHGQRWSNGRWKHSRHGDEWRPGRWH